MSVSTNNNTNANSAANMASMADTSASQIADNVAKAGDPTNRTTLTQTAPAELSVSVPSVTQMALDPKAFASPFAHFSSTPPAALSPEMTTKVDQLKASSLPAKAPDAPATTVDAQAGVKASIEAMQDKGKATGIKATVQNANGPLTASASVATDGSAAASLQAALSQSASLQATIGTNLTNGESTVGFAATAGKVTAAVTHHRPSGATDATLSFDNKNGFGADIKGTLDRHGRPAGAEIGLHYNKDGLDLHANGKVDQKSKFSVDVGGFWSFKFSTGGGPANLPMGAGQ